MIPKNIKRDYVIKAMEEIKRNGIPKGRNSRKFLLEFNGEYYPPKYVISLTNKYANGEILNPAQFSGGRETNDFLRNLGFNIIELSTAKKIIKPFNIKRERKLSNIHQGERCPKCKETIRKLLEKIYGRVEENYKFRVGTLPEDFKNTPYYSELKKIYEKLQNRGYRDFVKAKMLPNCDFFVPNPGFIVEFDESQHFTLQRKITLGLYPKNLELGFDKEKWIRLCEKINAKDNDPPYRDEQRAWYDTLRDFLPAILDLKPTVRLFAKDFIWCSLNPNNPEDVDRFRKMVELGSKYWKVQVKEDPNSFLARIIIASDWKGEPEEVKKLLEDIYQKWPKGKKVKFVITCGGFIQFEWPRSVSKETIGDSKNPNDRAVNILVAEAEKSAKSVLTENLCNKLREVTNYITLGVDSYKVQNDLNSPHIELVLLFDLKNNRFIHWTGKSYPLSDQQRGLVRITKLETHFVNLENFGKILVLGCHDLKMFDPRHYKRENMSQWRKDTIKRLHYLSEQNKPHYVLQHPHTTVKVRTWLNAWIYLKKMLPSVEKYASAGRYYESDRNPSDYDGIDDVLSCTKHGDTIDFIVYLGGNK